MAHEVRRCEGGIGFYRLPSARQTANREASAHGPIRLMANSRDIRIEPFTELIKLHNTRGNIELSPPAKRSSIHEMLTDHIS